MKAYRTTFRQRARSISAILIILGVLLAGCVGANTTPVYRIGLVAPFEGRYRELGYDMIYAARLALRESLTAGTMDGYRVELVAYDDSGDPQQATRQARALVADPAVLIAIGHARAETTHSALPVYLESGLPLIVFESEAVNSTVVSGVFILDATPEEKLDVLGAYLEAHGMAATSIYRVETAADVTTTAALAQTSGASLYVGDSSWGTHQFHELTRDLPAERWFLTGAAWPQDLPDGPEFRERLLASNQYVPEPGPLAALTYDAVRLALVAIARAHDAGSLTRTQVREALGATDFNGLTGPVTFDASGFRRDAPLYLYRWTEEEIPLLVEQLR
jgi:branched-chain amino acid transport system substrate-binding protein